MGVSAVMGTGLFNLEGGKKRSAAESGGEEAVRDEEGMPLETTMGRE